MTAPIILQRGTDELRIEYDPATGEVELRIWGRLSERDLYAPSVERLQLHRDTVPLLLDGLERLMHMAQR